MARILLFDEDQDLSMYYSEALTMLGHCVYATSDSDEILDKISQINPQLIILDVKFRDDSRMQLLEVVRNQFPDISVIIHTVDPSIKNHSRVVNEWCLLKSFDIRPLQHAITGSLCHDLISSFRY